MRRSVGTYVECGAPRILAQKKEHRRYGLMPLTPLDETRLIHMGIEKKSTNYFKNCSKETMVTIVYIYKNVCRRL